jgi:hypothetical protein
VLSVDGLKGTLSEAELFTLRTRLYEGRWNKARKGLLRFPLPIGYVLTADGSWVLDPDTQVRERLGYVFDSFRRQGVVRAVVRDLRQQGLELPTRVMAKEAYGSLVWKAPTLSAVVRILHNPAYAGAYVYGRSEYFSEQRSPKTGKASAHVHLENAHSKRQKKRLLCMANYKGVWPEIGCACMRTSPGQRARAQKQSASSLWNLFQCFACRSRTVREQ